MFLIGLHVRYLVSVISQKYIPTELTFLVVYMARLLLILCFPMSSLLVTFFKVISILDQH